MIATLQPQTAQITTVDALWALIQGQTKAVRKALAKRILEDEALTKSQQQMVRESLNKAFDELHSGQAKHDARKLFAE